MFELIRPFMIFTGLFLYEVVPGTLQKHFPLSENGAKVLCGIAVIVSLYALDLLLRKGASASKVLRRIRYSPNADFEGLWIQKVAVHDRPYSISRIEYLSDGRWSYSGIGYKSDFTPAAEWMTTSLNYDKKPRRWYFGGDSWLLEWDRGAGHYHKIHRGYVSPILTLPNSTADPVEGTVIDLDLNGQNNVFLVTLRRGQNLYPVQLSSIEKIKWLKPKEVMELLVNSNSIVS